MRALIAQARLTAREHGLGAAALRALRYPWKRLFVPGALRALQEGRQHVRSLDELFDFVNGFNYRGISITSWQKRDEIVSLLRLVDQADARSIAEIGTASGGTLFMLSQIAAPNATIIAVDLPGGQFGGELSLIGQRYPSWRARLYRGFAREDQIIHVMRADSHDASTVEAVERRLPEGKLDFLFIDGDHSYEGVRRDFELYSPLVREGGLVAMHDIVPSGPGGQGDPGDVPAFWREVRERHRVEAEYVEDWNWGSCGIGVLRL